MRIGGRHQYRLVLCGHKAVEAGAVCLVLMVQGQLMDVTASHFLIAAQTGLLAMSPTAPCMHRTTPARTPRRR